MFEREESGLLGTAQSSQGTGAFNDLSAQLTLDVPFYDKGSGIVNIVPRVPAAGVSGTFTRATTATTVSSVGTVLSIASGSPRSAYKPGTNIGTYVSGGYMGYLAESASVNLVLQSEALTNAAWAQVGTPVLLDGQVTCGSVNLSNTQDDSAAALEGITQTITFTGDLVKSVSFYVSQATSTSSVIRLRDTIAAADRLFATITWSGGVPSVAMTTGTFEGTDALMDTAGIGAIFRLRFQTTAVTAANTNSLQWYPATDAALAINRTGIIVAGGFQAEDSVICTSYIPTAAATVTRNADVLTYPMSPWYNTNESTMVARWWAPSKLDYVIYEINDGTTNNRWGLYRNTANSRISGYSVTAAVGDGDASSSGDVAAGSRNTCSIAFRGNDMQPCLNATTGNSNDGSVLMPPGMTQIQIGFSTNTGNRNYYMDGGGVERIFYSPRRLDNETVFQMARNSSTIGN